MTIWIDESGWNRFRESAEAALIEATEDTIAELKQAVHVDSGRLQKSIRISSLLRDRERDVVISQILVGGVALYGVVKERDKIKPVNYSLFEEIRHPQLRNTTPKSMSRAIRSKLK